MSTLTPPPTPTRNPTDLLAEQAQTLLQINGNIAALNNQLRQLQTQGKVGNQISVSVEDVNMPFLSMVGLLVKWALASIPAALILMVVFGCLFFTLSLGLGMLGGLGSLLGN